jgi:hypothetical protein
MIFVRIERRLKQSRKFPCSVIERIDEVRNPEIGDDSPEDGAETPASKTGAAARESPLCTGLSGQFTSVYQ